MNYSVTAIYFSPTDTSRKGVHAIAKTLSGHFNEIDMTCKACEAQFTSDDVVVFGAPVYGGRLFKGFVKRLAEVKGDNTLCIVTVTYGNRDYDDALLEFCDLLTSKGFIPVAAAAAAAETISSNVMMLS